jgi:hypothetical protein
LTFEDSHTECERLLNAAIVLSLVGVGNHRDAKLAEHPDTRSRASIHQRLQQRHKSKLRNEDCCRRERHPRIDMESSMRIPKT